ncbi:MAG: response regulator [Deltaproteobacteria bacterium]|nr:response regulator [Deltaproteobacteria bacterium]
MSSRPIRVLLVDDEAELVEYLTKRLTRKGHSVVGTLSGRDAVAALDGQTFDVAVLDLKMPQMDGLEVLRQAKSCQPFLEVVILTGHGSIESALESGRHQALRFLSKPYEFDDLSRVIEEAAAAKRQHQKAAFLQAMKELATTQLSAQEILAETERLQREYEQE